MNLRDFQLGIEEAYFESEITNGELDIMENAYINDLRTASKLTALYCMRESADISTFNAYEASSAQSFLVKMKDSFVERCSAVRAFVTKCIEKVKSYFQEKAIQHNLKKLEKLCKEDPAVAGITIEVSEFTPEEELRRNAELEKVQVKLASLGMTDEEIQTVTNEAMGIQPNIFKRATMKVGSVITSIKNNLKLLDGLKALLNKIESTTLNLMEKVKAKMSVLGAAVGRLGSKIVAVGRERLRIINESVHKLMSVIAEKIKAAFTAIKARIKGNTSPAPGPVGEGVDDMLDDILADIYQESLNPSMSDIF